MQNCILYNSAFRVSVAAEKLKIAFSLFGQFNLGMVGAVVLRILLIVKFLLFTIGYGEE